MLLASLRESYAAQLQEFDRSEQPFVVAKLDELHDLGVEKASDEFSAKAIGEERHKAEHQAKLDELLKVCR